MSGNLLVFLRTTVYQSQWWVKFDIEESIENKIHKYLPQWIYGGESPHGRDKWDAILNTWSRCLPGWSFFLVCAPIEIFAANKGVQFRPRYDGGVIVNRSMEMGEPVVFVSMNYRLARIFRGCFGIRVEWLFSLGFLVRSMTFWKIVSQQCPALGFLGGKEAKAAGVGNIGLHDRRSQSITLPTNT